LRLATSSLEVCFGTQPTFTIPRTANWKKKRDPPRDSRVVSCGRNPARARCVANANENRQRSEHHPPVNVRRRAGGRAGERNEVLHAARESELCKFVSARVIKLFQKRVDIRGLSAHLDSDKRNAVPVSDCACDLAIQQPPTSVVDHVPVQTANPPLAPDKWNRRVGCAAHNGNLPVWRLVQ